MSTESSFVQSYNNSCELIDDIVSTLNSKEQKELNIALDYIDDGQSMYLAVEKLMKSLVINDKR